MLVGCGQETGDQLRRRLSGEHWDLVEVQSGSEALELLLSKSADLLLVSAPLPDLDATEFQLLVRQQHPATQVVCLGSGLSQTVEKRGQVPGSAEGELSALLRLDVHRAGMQEKAVPATSSGGAAEHGWEGITGQSPGMRKVFHVARLVARRDTTVLIQGESGTGKDLLARAIHNVSARAKQPFVVINCAAIPEALLEAELFGHTKGAFTGASQSRLGRVHAAHGGTLFLDEIGDMPLSLQSKILRFLEQGEVQRIGSSEISKVDCRIIAATNVELKSAAQQGRFREDLYYRLAVFPVQLPPLRERAEDVSLLASLFLARFCPGLTLHSQAESMLLQHSWPGNVRELRNVMERASLLADDRREVSPEDIVL